MKKNILYVITQGERGGAQRYVFDLATNLVNTYDVSIAIGELKGDKTLQSKLKTQNSKLKIIELKHLKRAISPIHDILAVFELAKLYKTLKPDIIHLNSSKVGIIGSFARLMAYGLRLRVVYTVHGWVFNEPNRKFGKWLYRWLEKFTARWKDKIIVLSDRDFDDGVKLGIDKNKLIKIPLGIDMPKFLDKEEAKRFLSSVCHSERSEVEPRNPFPPKADPPLAGNNNVQGIPPLSALGGSVGMTVWVGTIANLYKTKGLDVLIEAIKILNIKYSILNIKFVIIGEGPERKNLEFRIKNYELGDTVYLTGTIDNASQYLKAFDLFVLPSRKEGTPYTILEAMAAQIPIIATKVGGMPEMIDKNLLVESENPKQLAEKISYLINHLDEAKKNASLLQSDGCLNEMLNKTKAIYFF